MAGNKVIAVDLGGTHLRVAIVEKNKILDYIKKRTPNKKSVLVKELISSIESLISKDIKGIGVASPGPLEKGIIRNTPNLPLKNFNLKKALEKRFKKRVEVENDASCVALAEAKFGCKKKNFFILTLGTGIGGGIIINGELYQGKGFGGELGHIVLDKGKFFEDLAAWKSVGKTIKKSFGKEIGTDQLVKMNNSKSKKILQELSKYLSQGIASLINVFDPEIVVLSGGMSKTGNKFLTQIRNQVPKYLLIPRKPKIVWTKLKHPGILGASLLIK